MMPSGTDSARVEILADYSTTAPFETLALDTPTAIATIDFATVPAACAGNQFGVDRERLRKGLGFARLTRNSMDAVSD